MKILYSKNYPRTAYRFIFETKYETTFLKKRWVLVLYFYKWFIAFSNLPLN